MAQFQPPEKLNFADPRWEEWKNSFLAFSLITELKKKSVDIQIATLKYCMGNEAEEILKTFNLTDEQSKSFDIILARFDDYFKPKKNIIRLRRIFNRRLQEEGEDIEIYLRALYNVADDCSFTDKKERIRDQFVAGIQDEELAEKLELMYLHNSKKFTLETVLEYARTYSDVKKGRSKNSTNQHDVNFVKKNMNKSTLNCSYCGSTHATNKCPAYGKQCTYCHKKNHFASVCRSKKKNQQVNNLNENIPDDTANEEPSESFLGECQTEYNANKWIVKLSLFKENEISFKVDTGADVTIINYETFSQVKHKPPLQPSTKNLFSPAGKINIKGMFKGSLGFKGKLIDETIYVLAEGNKSYNLLSRKASVCLQIVQFIGSCTYDDKIYGFGKWDTLPVKFHVKENAVPYAVTAARNIAIPLYEPTKKALDKMIEDEVIEPVNHPTDWVSPMVPVVKSSSKDKIRITVDYRKLNMNLKRETYQIPTFEELSSRFSGATRFSKLDASSGFFQIPIDEESRDLTTFMTPFGRYKFKRLPMGVNIAPEIYQKKMNELLMDLDGVICYLDDVVVFGKTEKEHDDNLNMVMKRIMESGLKLNKDKCSYNQMKIEFLGHVIHSGGIEMDPTKISAVENLEPPKNIGELRRFLGMVNFLTKFIPMAQTILHPLNALLKKDTCWTWNEKQEGSFQAIKKLISSSRCLAFYDVNKETILSVDASSFGLGGVLLQRHDEALRPIAFCSRSLTDNERRWAQIEKELLAATYAVEKFHIFLCGLNFTLNTDHKPLVPLINTKDLTEAPLRCQRLLMRLARYTLTALYVPGKYLVVADNLSRSPELTTTNSVSDISIEVEAYVNFIMSQFNISNKQLSKLKHEQEIDEHLSQVIYCSRTGWIAADDNENLKAYYNEQSCISVTDDDILLFQNRLIIPKTMQREMLQRIHDDGHMSLHKCRKRAAQSVWWPTISKDLKSYVENCNFCQEHRRNNRKEPLKPTPLPRLPWTKIGVDIFHHQGKNYLVSIDYFSRWIEMPQIQYMTSSEVIRHLTSQFARWGVPEEIRSDGGPQFTSHEFEKFCTSFNVTHTKSSPYNPQSNGAAERAVQTAKRIIKQENPSLALLSYRSTPLQVTGFSPAQLMMGRNLRTLLPISDIELQPEWPELSVVQENDSKAKLNNEKNFNTTHGTRVLPEIKPGDKIRSRLPHEKKWSQKETVPEDNLFHRQPTRNRRFLQSCPINDELLGDRTRIPSPPTESDTVLRRSERRPQPVMRYEA